MGTPRASWNALESASFCASPILRRNREQGGILQRNFA
jgi:hypothetical protein